MRLIRSMLSLFLLITYCVSNVFPLVVCREADGQRTIEIAFGGRCDGPANESEATPSPDASLGCADCVDTPLAQSEMTSRVKHTAHSLAFSPHPAPFASQGLLLVRPSVRGTYESWPPMHNILIAHRTVVLTV